MEGYDEGSSDSMDGDITLSRDALARRPSYRKILDDLSADVKSSTSSEGDKNDADRQTNSNGGSSSMLSSNDGRILFPMATGYQIGTLGGQSLYVSSGSSHGDDSTRKRQVRLLKNRLAAKECRRKKKEYVKCLENRVAVLENQNRALIEELKSLKELYCQKDSLSDTSFIQ